MKTLLHPFRSLLLSLPLILFCGCGSSSSTVDNNADWSAKVKTHLTANEAGALVWESLEAHGGLANWLDAGTLEFRWTYSMRDMGTNAVVDTIQQIEPSTMRASAQIPDTETRFGWDGEAAWIIPPDSKDLMVPPRFWALTPYYFVAMPFVFGDLNARFAALPDFEFEGTTYQQVRVTYTPEAGDAPDDYYILLIHPETKLVDACRYIVTSKLVTEQPKPEKLITMEYRKPVGDFSLPTFHRSFPMEGEEVGGQIRDALATEYKWLPNAPDFSAPAGAKAL